MVSYLSNPKTPKDSFHLTKSPGRWLPLFYWTDFTDFRSRKVRNSLVIQGLRVRTTEYSAPNPPRVFRDLYLDSRRRLSSLSGPLYAQPSADLCGCLATKTLIRSICAHRACEGCIPVSGETITGWLLITGSARPRIKTRGGGGDAMWVLQLRGADPPEPAGVLEPPADAHARP